MADIGGGGILDIGCYPITAARFLFDAEPKRVVSLVERDPVFKTDRLACVLADFGGGRQLSFICSTQAAPHQRVQCSAPRASSKSSFRSTPRPTSTPPSLIDSGGSLDGTLSRREIIPPATNIPNRPKPSPLAVLGEKPLPWGVEDAIASMRVLDAVFASEKTGAWATV